MTFEKLVEANASIKTTDIKGKDYAEVNQRIKAFRMLYPEGTIETELVSDDGNRCLFRAVVKNEEGKVLGTGTAFEVKSESYINKTSYIENCETSAVGRALAMCGVGIDTSIASAEEVKNAITQQEAGKKVEKPKTEPTVDSNVKALLDKAKEKNVPIEDILKHYGKEKAEDLTDDEWARAMRKLHITKCKEQE